jgi:hypothetical protein
MIDPEKKDIGRKVRYVHKPDGEPAAEGIVTGFDLHHVFVLYGNHTTSKGSRRRDLAWADDATN